MGHNVCLHVGADEHPGTCAFVERPSEFVKRRRPFGRTVPIMALGPSARCPTSHRFFFGWEENLLLKQTTEKVGTLILSSVLEDLEHFIRVLTLRIKSKPQWYFETRHGRLAEGSSNVKTYIIKYSPLPGNIWQKSRRLDTTRTLHIPTTKIVVVYCNPKLWLVASPLCE